MAVPRPLRNDAYWEKRRSSPDEIDSRSKIYSKKIMMASKVWKVVQPHVPMIKFRKSGGINPAAAVSANIAPSVSRPGPSHQMQRGASGATGPGVIVLPTIEDIQLPLRFQRRPIDAKEIEYINRGGPE